MAAALIELKTYQEKALDTLEAYLANAVADNPNDAFYKITRRPYVPVPALPDLPYVCLRVPTGGGKTLMAAHAIGRAADVFLKHERPAVVWLVPSTAILEQTLAALRNREHPYRDALTRRFGEAISVMDITEALYVSRADLDGTASIIVATIQSFRVEDTEGRKVYEQNGNLQDHFSGRDEREFAGLDLGEGGKPVPSLANVLRMHRPLVLVDEAHNARTGLSFDTLARLNPSLVIEFTATPVTEHKPEKGVFASNVLTHVSAAELKAENMIKLPIVLRGREDWKTVVSDAIRWRDQLEDIAKAERAVTKEYIRPIMLFQAQRQLKGKETITPSALKQVLIDDFHIPEDQIKIATGNQWELGGIDLFKEDCPVRHVITVQALREGWDCSFAYVLCSIAEQQSPRAVEQLLGRVLRLPQAEQKVRPELNEAYAFAATLSFKDTANALVEGLVENGFERFEAHAAIRDAEFTGFGEGGEGYKHEEVLPEAEDIAEVKRQIEVATGGRVTVDASSRKIAVQGAMSEQDRTTLALAFANKPDIERIARRLYLKSRGARLAPVTAAAAKLSLRVPLLTVKTGDLFEPFEKDHFLNEPWAMEGEDSAPLLERFAVQEQAAQEARIDVDQGKMKLNFVADVHLQLALLAGERNWTKAALVNWLDKRIPNRADILPLSSKLFLGKLLDRLESEKGLELADAAQAKYRLSDAINRFIAERKAIRAQDAFRRFLDGLGPKAHEFRTSSDIEMVFEERNYAYRQPYRGSTVLDKHQFEIIGDLEAKGEEFDCALHISRLPQVDTWIRNTDRQKGSFWLQTSSDKFYPDFIARLKDGRILVVEYKGALNKEDDTREKEFIGQVWADASTHCIFVMCKDKDYQAIDRAIKA
jgi:type III restriction enzyme